MYEKYIFYTGGEKIRVKAISFNVTTVLGKKLNVVSIYYCYCTDQTSTRSCREKLYLHMLGDLISKEQSGKMILLQVNIFYDSSYVGSEMNNVFSGRSAGSSGRARLPAWKLAGSREKIGVSIKCGRHRRGCFLLVKVYRKSGDGAALSPVAPHHKSHFPLFKP